MSNLGERYRQLFADIAAEKNAAVAAERERCAKIAEQPRDIYGIGAEIAAAIRAQE